MPFKRYVEVGRICLVNFGEDFGKLVVISDVLDQNRVGCGAWGSPRSRESGRPHVRQAPAAWQALRRCPAAIYVPQQLCCQLAVARPLMRSPCWAGQPSAAEAASGAMQAPFSAPRHLLDATTDGGARGAARSLPAAPCSMGPIPAPLPVPCPPPCRHWWTRHQTSGTWRTSSGSR